MLHFKLRYGLNKSGVLVLPGTQSFNESSQCPSCRTDLTSAYEDIRAPYFSHVKNPDCSIESAEYETAKLLIKEAITNNGLDLRTILLKTCCYHCRDMYYAELPPGTFISGIENMTIEGHEFDYIAYKKDNIAYLAIKIIRPHHLHHAERRNIYASWIELNPNDVINAAYDWNPTNSNLKPKYCESCKDVWNIVNNSRGQLHFYSPENASTYLGIMTHYIATTETCFSCHEETPVYWWKGVPFCETKPPEPRPTTIKFRYSKRYGGSYWGNTCVNCGALQGDNFLYILDKAPFKKLPLTDKAKGSAEPKEFEEHNSILDMFKFIGQ